MRLLPAWSTTTFRFPDEVISPPFFDRAHVQEKAFPWRFGIGWLFRMPLSKRCLVVMHWYGYRDSEETDEGNFLSFRELDDFRQIMENWDVVPEQQD